MSLLKKLFTPFRSLKDLRPEIAPDAVEIRRRIDGREADKVFAWLNQLKGRHVPRRNVDFLRALCFVKLNQPPSAIESLKEELRYFPDHAEASALLAQLRPPEAAAPLANDPEFARLLVQVQPYTMLSEGRLFSLFTLARAVCVEDIPGNFVECGVAAGGSSALLGAVIARYSKRERRLFSCDTFEGMPAPGSQDTHAGQPAEQTPSLPDARPRSDRFRCGGRESEFLAAMGRSRWLGK